MPQQNFYIPDELAERVKRFKDRMNVSQLCAAALRQEVERLERQSRVGAMDMTELIAKWSEQKKVSVSQWEEAGREAADEWIKGADYDDMRLYGESEEGEQDYYYDAPEGERLGFSLPLECGSEVNDLARFNADFDLPTFLRAWHERVQEVWQDVRHQL